MIDLLCYLSSGRFLMLCLEKSRSMAIFQRYLHSIEGHNRILLVNNCKNDDDHKNVAKDI